MAFTFPERSISIWAVNNPAHIDIAPLRKSKCHHILSRLSPMSGNRRIPGDSRSQWVFFQSVPGKVTRGAPRRTIAERSELNQGYFRAITPRFPGLHVATSRINISTTSNPTVEKADS